jgi:hypothetical protein
MSYYLNLSFLSNKQDNLQKAERQKLLSAEARRILSLCEDGDFAQDDIAQDVAGRPFFSDRDMDFNISHSGNLTAVSLVRGKNLRTGCDVELVRPRSRAKEIAKDYFTASEINYIESGGSFGEARFYQIWTLKECFLKLKGLSVLDMGNAPSFISDDGQFAFGATVSSPLSFNLYDFSNGAGKRYILAIALEGKEEQPEIKWFSQVSLDCKSIAKINAAPSPAETVIPKI